MLNHPNQCIILVFDGLLPEPHNSSILRLLFICAHWHGLAKLRMHTDQTLNILDGTTVQMGTAFHAFTDKTCPSFEMHELNHKMEAQQQRQLKQSGSKKPEDTTPNQTQDQ